MNNMRKKTKNKTKKMKYIETWKNTKHEMMTNMKHEVAEVQEVERVV